MSAGRARCSAPAQRPEMRLFSAALGDWLHEPYRPQTLDASERRPLPAGGATLSGSGPTVIVASDAGCAPRPPRPIPGSQILGLDVAPRGAL